MRRIWILLAGVALAAGLALTWRQVQQRETKTLRLPDGSQLTLLKVTYGTNHVCRFGNRWQDLFYPILPKKLRARFRPRVTSLTAPRDGIVVWFRRIGLPPGLTPTPYLVSAMDGYELETEPLHTANATVRVNPGQEFCGWILAEYPRRSKEFTVRVYELTIDGQYPHVGDFVVVNRRRQTPPGWVAEPLPVSRETNGLKFTLTGLETGLTTQDTRMLPAGKDAKAFARATFKVEENGAPTEHWGVRRITARNAAGESKDRNLCSLFRRSGGMLVVDFPSGLWLEEPAWRLTVSFERSAGFSAEELWRIEHLSVPGERELIPTRMVTNKIGEELEFLGVSRAHANRSVGHATMSPQVKLHFRTAYPLDDLRLWLVKVTDDRGRQLKSGGYSTTTSTGGRGNTPKELLYEFGVEIPDDAKTLDVTLAATRILTVEYQVKPILTESARGK